MIHLVRLDSKTNTGNENRLSEVLRATLPGREFARIKSVSDFLLRAMAGEVKEILFAVSVPENGFVPEWQDLMASLVERPGILAGAKAVVLVDGKGPLFTKSIARRLIFAANSAGCAFPGKPLVEATGDLYNFNTVAQVKGIDNRTAYIESVSELLDKLEDFSLGGSAEASDATPSVALTGSLKKVPKKVLAIHAGNKETSNSLMLLDLVKSHFGDGVDYDEISIRNGDIVDCRGCDFDTCKHFGESGECFYGGVMVERVYPAILDCDALLLVCPNYNDAVGANMMAMFNRLTALFYNNSFAEKEIFALIVSGYSGSELLAEQIIGAMNCNKGFILPGHFALMETANDPGSILAIPEIERKAADFAQRIEGISQG